MAPPRLLIIAGSDSSGGAGIQADIKTACAFGVYAMTAITAVTAQDTTGVHAMKLMPPDLVAAQMRACLKDIGADAIKIGMLGSAEIARAVIETLRDHRIGIPIVLDPVIASSSGTPLLDDEGIAIVGKELLPFSTIVTPNLHEGEVLTGLKCDDLEGVKRAALALTQIGVKSAVIKGGHGSGSTLTDVFVNFGRYTLFEHPKRQTMHTHGTGCTFSTAIACAIVGGHVMEDAVRQAHAYVQQAITTAPGFGHGNGPLNHPRLG